MNWFFNLFLYMVWERGPVRFFSMWLSISHHNVLKRLSFSYCISSFFVLHYLTMDTWVWYYTGCCVFPISVSVFVLGTYRFGYVMLLCHRVWNQGVWYHLSCFSFSRLLAIQVFCGSINILALFILVLWKMPLVFW